MRIVEKAELPPAKCAITGDIDGPFVDTESWLPEVDPRIYLHVPVVKQIARDLLGMVPEEDVQDLRDAVSHLSDMCEELQEQVKAYETIEQARKVVA